MSIAAWLRSRHFGPRDGKGYMKKNCLEVNEAWWVIDDNKMDLGHGRLLCLRKYSSWI